MHYYQHHIGDFIKDTSNLNDHQLATYMRMLWTYYTEEMPFESDLADIAFAVRSDESTVSLLLKHYFSLVDGRWHHARCDREISIFHGKSSQASASAKKRWQCERNANAMRTHTENNANASFFDANQEPITNKLQLQKEKRASPSKRLVKPDLVSQENWDAWLQFRKAMMQNQKKENPCAAETARGLAITYIEGIKAMTRQSVAQKYKDKGTN